MWSDNISVVDMLSFKPYAGLVTDLVTQQRLDPVTLGLIGSWGSGKSTLLNMVCEQIDKSDENIVTIKVNAWLFEGYDDAKTALMESILIALQSKDDKTLGDGIKDKIGKLIKRVDWIRVGGTLVKKGVPIAASIATGNPMPMILNAVNGLKDFDITDKADQEKISSGFEFIKGFMNEEEQPENLVKSVSSFRDEFSDMLKESDISKLIILVDDLDRCNPDRIMETLEAIKLFFSVENTAFILAIDEEIIKYSIKRRYPRIDSDEDVDVAKDYIEKIVQIPIKLPELSEIDIKNYMLLLICEMFLSKEDIEMLIDAFIEKEMFTKGEIISSQDIKDNIPEETNFSNGLNRREFDEYIDVFGRVGDVISYSTLKGNPRQTKRFLNSFFIRKKLADLQKIELDLSVLAKLMVLEYTDQTLFKQIYRWQYNEGGIATKLNEIEMALKSENADFDTVYKDWSRKEIKQWILIDPNNIGSLDLRQYFYLSRDGVRDKEISMLNISVEERSMIAELCSGIDRSVLKRKIEALNSKSSDFVNNVVKGFIVRYKQAPEEHITTLVDLLLLLKSNTTELLSTLRGTNQAQITPTFLTSIRDLESNLEEFESVICDLLSTQKLKDTYAAINGIGGVK